MRLPILLIILLTVVLGPTSLYAQSENIDEIKEALENGVLNHPEEISEIKEFKEPISHYTIFDDRLLLNGYSKKYEELSKEVLIAMIKDETLTSYKAAAAIRVFRNKFGEEVVSKEKRRMEKTLLRRLNRTTSPYVQVEIMYTLNTLDRYRYFKSMTPALIQKLDHYNETVNEIAFDYLEDITQTSNYRAREARIVFNTLRKVMFLSRKRLAKIDEPDPKLSRKLKILRWSIKVLGNQELKRLPKEVLGLL